jgi:hypothetical protein
MVSRLILSIIIALVFTGCSRDETTAPIQPQTSDDLTNAEYTVLATITDSLHSYHTVSKLFLWDSTNSGINFYDSDSTLFQYLQQNVSTLRTETLQDFTSKNLVHTYIQNPTKIHPACVYSSTAPGSFPWMSVSRVGFSSDGQQALAYVGRIDAPLAGAGCIYVLSQKNGRWVIDGIVIIWIS